MYALSRGSARMRMLAYVRENPGCDISALPTLEIQARPASDSSWVPFADYARLCAAVAGACNDKLAAVRIALNYEPALSGLIGYLSANQPTLRDALACLCRHSDFLMRGARIDLEECETVATVRYAIDLPDEEAAFDVELELAMLVAYLRAGMPDFRPRQISLRHQVNGEASEMRRILGTRIAGGQAENALIFDKRVLDRPLTSADPELRRTLERLMGLAGLARSNDDLIASLRSEIALRLSDRDCSIECLADALGMTPRTLQRHLTAQGETFSSLRDSVRRERAFAMLAHSSLPIGEVSYRLGFTEVSSFYRSFRQWTGMAPGAYRKRAVSEAAPARVAIALDRISEGELSGSLRRAGAQKRSA